MEAQKSDQRVDESEKDMKPAALSTDDAKKQTKDQGDDQSVVPTLTKDLVRMIESSQDGKLDLKAATEELKAPRSTVDFVSSILEGIQFLKRISSDIVQIANMSGSDKLTKRLEESWTEDSTVDGWISQLKSLRFSSPDEKQAKGEHKSSKTNETPSRAKGNSSTAAPQTTMRTLLSPHPVSSSPSSTTSSTSYPRPARRRTTPVYIFGQSTPFKKQFTPADRLVQVSSEDTDESNPSSKSDASGTNFSSPASNSNFSTPESLPHPLSPAATMRNARSRVLLLDNSPDHDSLASSRGNTAQKSNKEVALSPAAAAAAKTAQAAMSSSNLKDYDLSNKKRVIPSFVSKQSSGDEVSKRPKK